MSTRYLEENTYDLWNADFGELEYYTEKYGESQAVSRLENYSNTFLEKKRWNGWKRKHFFLKSQF